MRLASIFSPLLTLALAAALLSTSACSSHFGSWQSSSTSVFGQSVSDENGVLKLNGTQLPFSRWVDVSLEVGAQAALELGTATDAIRVTGVAGTTAALRVQIHSEQEGDGDAVLKDGRLVATSTGGREVFINAIEGTLPATAELKLVSGTGEVQADSLSAAALQVSVGTGALTLRDCNTGSIKVKSGTGDITITQGASPSLDVESGTGSVSLSDWMGAEVSLTTGTGGLSLTRCSVEDLHCKSGTGDLLLDGGKLVRVDFTGGTGHVTQRNDAQVGSLTAR